MTVDQTQVGRPEESSGAAVLELRDVAVHFGGVKAVDGVTLRLEPGLIYGIIGPNGSGKTTLIGAITRLTRLTRGDLLFDGSDYTSVRPDRLVNLGVARTFQTVRLLPDLTVQQNIQLGADARTGRGAGKEAAPRGDLLSKLKGFSGLAASPPSPAVARAIERTGLEGFEAYYPTELSYGTQRRVEIARAMAMNPRLLLLDEPTAGMNPRETQEMTELIGKLRDERGFTIVVIEHDMRLVKGVSDRVVALDYGRKIADGTYEEVANDERVVEAYLGKRAAEAAG
jgi:branched-chain amino acid transport system ATP-binding protein